MQRAAGVAPAWRETLFGQASTSYGLSSTLRRWMSSSSGAAVQAACLLERLPVITPEVEAWCVVRMPGLAPLLLCRADDTCQAAAR